MAASKKNQQVNDELLKKIEELTEANRSKNAFIANISHEIRTPMNAISGFAELLLQLDASDEVNEYASEIKSASSNLLAIINDLLDISKIESGRMELVPVPYYLHYLFTDIESVISIPANKKGIDFRINANPELPSQLYGDIVRIRQILTNICNNAVKFTNEGYVELSATFTEGEEPDGIFIEFTIKDTGIGIRKDDLELIFDKFRQVDMRLNRNVEGSGLGLSICRQLVELMEGTIDVDSVYGQGTTFKVRIPQKVLDRNKLSNYLLNRKLEEKKKTVLFAPSARVLVVDDNPVNLKILRGLLLHYEIDADTAAGGKEAVDMAAKTAYDLILMDQMMPGMSGEEALLAIRKIPDSNKADVPIVAVTANAIRGMRDEFIRRGFTDYLSKPVETEKLEQMLKNNLAPHLIVSLEEEESGVQDDLDIEINGIDVDAGLSMYDGNAADYTEILEAFAEYGPEKITEIEGFAKDKDYENYVIAVHALKSVAANIGAHQLYTMAKIHEFAGKGGNMAFIDANHGKLLALYESIIGNIQTALAELEKKEQSGNASSESDNNR
ncbi:MAG: response regulator [Lachnospiraceae bacterium]|nr:response regulator [Lachnospiraceae bacterium]